MASLNKCLALALILGFIGGCTATALTIVKQGDSVKLACTDSPTIYPVWVGPPDNTLYNYMGLSTLNPILGEKLSRLSWDPDNNKSLIIRNVMKNDSGTYICRYSVDSTVMITTHVLSVRGTGDCPDGFIVHQNSCYMAFSQLATWQEAQTYCEAYGGYLIEISDQLEEHFVTGYIQRLGKDSFKVGMFWLGGTDSDREGTWVWQHAGALFSVTYWKAGEPNNAGTGEDCVQLSFNDGLLWNDMPCSTRLNFICEVTKNEGGIVIG